MTAPANAQFVPGMFVTKAPMAFQVHRTHADTGTPLVLLCIEHATGSTTLIMMEPFAQTLCQKLTEVCTGLVLASPWPQAIPTNRGGT